MVVCVHYNHLYQIAALALCSKKNDVKKKCKQNSRKHIIYVEERLWILSKFHLLLRFVHDEKKTL